VADMPIHRKSKAIPAVIHPVSTGFKERVLTADVGYIFLQRPERGVAPLRRTALPDQGAGDFFLHFSLRK
jgi:hypothetical protein